MQTEQTEQLYTLIVDGEIATEGLLLEVAKKAASEWKKQVPNSQVEIQPEQ